MKYLPYNASIALFELLCDIHHELSERTIDAEALPIIQGLLNLYESASKLQERDQIVHGLVVSICPLRANGLGDAVIWTACRQWALHREAEKLTTVTNNLRSRLQNLVQEMRSAAEF